MKKIVIFGAAGFIGAYLTDYLKSNLPEEYEVITAVRKHESFFIRNGIKTVVVDICNGVGFDSLPVDNVYAVINLTGILPAYIQDFDPFAYIDTNIKGSIRILEYARNAGADRVLYTQTWAVQAGYWGKEEILSPAMPMKLIYRGDHAFYAITKSMVEETMEYYKQEYGLKSFVFRLPNVYMYAPQLFYYVNGVQKKIGYRYMINQAIQGCDLELWGDPEAFKDVLYIKDLCKMMYLALNVNLDGGIYNAGTGKKTTMREQLQGIINVFSPNPSRCRIIEKPEKASFISFVMDIENAKNELGYEPDYTYAKYLEDYKNEQKLKRFDELFKHKGC